MIDGLPNRPLYFSQKDIIDNGIWYHKPSILWIPPFMETRKWLNFKCNKWYCGGFFSIYKRGIPGTTIEKLISHTISHNHTILGDLR